MKRLSIIMLLFCLVVLGACTSTNEQEEVDKEDQEEQESVKNDIEDETENEQEVEVEEATVEPTSEKDAESNDEERTLGEYEVYLGGDMIETNDKIIIEGESNLLPGSRIVGQVTAGEDAYYADTSEIVQDDGSFYMEIENHPLDEETTVEVRFHFDGPQDEGIIRHYGDRGQKLQGIYVYQHEGELGGGKPQNIFKQAMVSTTFEPSEENSIRKFKDPSWYPMPKDMGDTRIWIEVDEINNDEEYFYIHGHSNIIEGSKLFVEYSNLKGDTQVLPDGSFDFKFPYEYLEDTQFKVQLKPEHYTQWNIVKETYGETGQKLVGNFVVKEKYNNNQFVEKIVEQESMVIEVPDNVELKVEGSEVTMLVPDNVLFDFDKFDLKESSKEVLQEISKSLATSFNKKDLNIAINGHTDNSGEEAYNLELSEKRAIEVKEYFESQLTDSEANFRTKGYGDTEPIASNEDEAGQAKNRRVEIVINLK